MDSPLQQDERAQRALREKARAVIDAGHISGPLPAVRWGGPGAGVPCSVCGETLGAHEFEIEMELRPADGAGSNNHHFHVHCVSALEYELCRRDSDPQRTALPGQPEPGGCSARDQNAPGR